MYRIEYYMSSFFVTLEACFKCYGIHIWPILKLSAQIGTLPTVIIFQTNYRKHWIIRQFYREHLELIFANVAVFTNVQIVARWIESWG